MKETIIMNLIYFFGSYLILFLIYVFVINRKRKVYSDGKKYLEVNYIVNKFNLDMRKVKYNEIKWTLTFINPLIMSTTFVIVINIKNTLLSLILGFIVMMMLIYSVYEIIGRFFKKRGEKNV